MPSMTQYYSRGKYLTIKRIFSFTEKIIKFGEVESAQHILILMLPINVRFFDSISLICVRSKHSQTISTYKSVLLYYGGPRDEVEKEHKHTSWHLLL